MLKTSSDVFIAIWYITQHKISKLFVRLLCEINVIQTIKQTKNVIYTRTNKLTKEQTKARIHEGKNTRKPKMTIVLF